MSAPCPLPLITDDGEFLVLLHVGPALSGDQSVLADLCREFYFLPARDIDLWMPASFPAWMRKAFGCHDEEAVARLKAGVTREPPERSIAA